MDLRVLRYFLAVADEGSISAAARQVRIAQPSLSRQLRSLESELGVELLSRDGRSVKLSPAGRRFLPIVRDLVARAESARGTMTALGQGTQPELVVAAHPTTIADVIAPFIAARGERLTVPTFVPASADEAYRLLARSDVDLAISAGIPPRSTATLDVARFPIWAQVPMTHPWAGLDAVPLQTVLAEPLIVLDATHGTRRTFDDVVGATKGSYDIAAEVTVPRIAQALAAAGTGVAIVTDDPTYDLRGVEIAGSDGPLQITLHAAWDATSYAAGTIRRFVAEFHDFCSLPSESQRISTPPLTSSVAPVR